MMLNLRRKMKEGKTFLFLFDCFVFLFFRLHFSHCPPMGHNDSSGRRRGTPCLVTLGNLIMKVEDSFPHGFNYCLTVSRNNKKAERMNRKRELDEEKEI